MLQLGRSVEELRVDLEEGSIVIWCPRALVGFPSWPDLTERLVETAVSSGRKRGT